jgi:diaminopropionate ammonia-lyase
VQGAQHARGEFSLCPHYSSTPLHRLPGAAAAAGVAEVYYKDEASRFGLRSFKALGGGYAVALRLQDLAARALGRPVALRELARHEHATIAGAITVTCASDGNHGRAVAAAARVFGCRCVVFLHEGVSAGRAEAIRQLGAEVVRTPGVYDDSVRAAASAAAEKGWELVSDTTFPGHEQVPLTVMQGYAVLMMESLDELRARRLGLPTHLFVQAGVGGLAAALTAYLWEALGDEAPVVVVVEPANAACLFRSALAGRAETAPGNLDVMAGLACGEVSEVAWRILSVAADAFMVIDDASAIEAMRLLAEGAYGAPPIVAGESATAGLAALLALARHPSERRVVDLTPQSRVLVIGTEGATDPDLYRELVGRSAEAVAASAGAVA